MPLFTFKERNSSLFCPIFLKLSFDNFTSPVGLAILKFYLPSLNFTSLGHQACTIFRRLCVLFQNKILMENANILNRRPKQKKFTKRHIQNSPEYEILFTLLDFVKGLVQFHDNS